MYGNGVGGLVVFMGCWDVGIFCMVCFFAFFLLFFYSVFCLFSLGI